MLHIQLPFWYFLLLVNLWNRSDGIYFCIYTCNTFFAGNAVGQIYLLNYLLGAENLGLNYSEFGIHIVQLLWNGKDVGEHSKIFPRVTMCDFKIRQFSNVQDYTVECALPVNLFSEKFFIFLWFWIVLVFFANAYSFLSWLWCTFTISRVQYIKKYIKLIERVKKSDRDMTHISCFAEEYLRHDGIFCLRMISANVNDVTTAQVIASLWSHYKSHHRDSPEYHKKHRYWLREDNSDAEAYGDSYETAKLNTKPALRFSANTEN